MTSNCILYYHKKGNVGDHEQGGCRAEINNSIYYVFSFDSGTVYSKKVGESIKKLNFTPGEKINSITYSNGFFYLILSNKNLYKINETWVTENNPHPGRKKVQISQKLDHITSDEYGNLYGYYRKGKTTTICPYVYNNNGGTITPLCTYSASANVAPGGLAVRNGYAYVERNCHNKKIKIGNKKYGGVIDIVNIHYGTRVGYITVSDDKETESIDITNNRLVVFSADGQKSGISWAIPITMYNGIAHGN